MTRLDRNDMPGLSDAARITWPRSSFDVRPGGARLVLDGGPFQAVARNGCLAPRGPTGSSWRVAGAVLRAKTHGELVSNG